MYNYILKWLRIKLTKQPFILRRLTAAFQSSILMNGILHERVQTTSTSLAAVDFAPSMLRHFNRQLLRHLLRRLNLI